MLGVKGIGAYGLVRGAARHKGNRMICVYGLIVNPPVEWMEI